MFWNTHNKLSLHLKNFTRIKKLSLAITVILSFLAGMLLSFYVAGFTRFSYIPSPNTEDIKEKASSLKPLQELKSISDFLASRSRTDTESKQKHNTTFTLENVEKGSSINFCKLTGTILSGNKKMAVFEDMKSNKQFVLKEGETLNDFRIMKIKRKSVLLETAVFQNAPRAEETAPQVMSTPKNASTVVKRIGPYHFEIAKRVMIDNLKDPAKFLKQVRLIPFIINGKSSGFILKNMQDKSFLKEIGFMEDDIITRINGENLNDTFTAIKEFASIGEQESVFVELSRNSKNITLKYTIR